MSNKCRESMVNLPLCRESLGDDYLSKAGAVTAGGS